VNRFRPEIDFRSLLEEAGLKQEKSPLFWAKTDQNENAALNGLFKETQQKAIEALPPPVRAIYEKLPKSQRLTFLQDALQKHAPHALTQKEKHFLEMIPKYLTNWRFTMNLVKSGAMIAMYTFVGGQLAMWIVYKTIARLDPDFEPNKKAAKSSNTPAPIIQKTHSNSGYYPPPATPSAPLASAWNNEPFSAYANAVSPLASMTNAIPFSAFQVSAFPGAQLSNSQFSSPSFSSQSVLPQAIHSITSGMTQPPPIPSMVYPNNFQGRRL
jgi:hypothetical protein